MERFGDYLAAKGVETGWLAAAMLFVLLVAIAFVSLARRPRATRLRSAMRVLMASKIWRSASAVLDYKYTVLNIFILPVLLVFVMVSTEQVAGALGAFLPPSPHKAPLLPEWQARIVLSAVLFLALEFAYWLDHYLSHKVPMLWEFHKVHHTAEVLTPLTVFRVHPLDTIFYYNIKSIVAGIAYGVAIFVLGCKPMATMEGAIIVVYMWLYGHLQHTQLWITFPGWLGKIFFSPAHHQIHHSKAAIHHNTNFGMSLTLFDRMFGTLHTPTREKQQLEFGIAEDVHEHRMGASLHEPIARAFQRLAPDAAKPAPNYQARGGTVT